ncbi:MAG: ADOP family duplicated permease, partial [Acidobacteriota bacterium]
AVLDHDAWRRIFGSDPSVIGRTVRINGQPVTIVGVAEPGFKGLSTLNPPAVWLPLTSERLDLVFAAFLGGEEGASHPMLRNLMTNRHLPWVYPTARLAPGASIEEARTEISGIGERLAETFPDTNADRELTVGPTNDMGALTGMSKVVLLAAGMALGLVGLVLLIACTNVASLVLARSAGRQREIATRMSLGAGHRRLVRQLLVESLVLALLGGAGGLFLAWLSNRLLSSIHLLHLPFPVDFDLDLALDGRVILFTTGVAVLTTVVFGLIPALQTVRLDPATWLRYGVGARASRRLHQVLVVVQVAFSVVFLIAAGLTLRSVVNAQEIDPGFDPAGVVVAHFNPRLQGYGVSETRSLLERLEGEVGALPGVRSVSWTEGLPLAGSGTGHRAAPESEWGTDEEDWHPAATMTVAPGYFEILGIDVLRGRGFTRQDRSTAVPVVVVNEELARRFWPGEAPLGKRLRVAGGEREYEVVGVVPTGKYGTLGEDPRPALYRAAGQYPIGSPTLVAKVDGDPAAVMGAIRLAVRRIDSTLIMTGPETLAQATSNSLLLARSGAVVFGLFGMLALVLTAVGLYGLIAFAVSQRTHEIGIRMAIGASRRDVTRMVVREGVRLTSVGLVLGLAGAALVTRVLRAVLYGVSPTDPLTFGAVTLLLGIVAVAASLDPARRAAEVDPQTALRAE